MSRNVADLIERVRRHTLNTGETANSGIPDSHFLDYLNDAQDRIQSLIVDAHNNVFETQTTASLIASTRTYALPADRLLKNKVILVEYSTTGNAKDYRPLRKTKFRELRNIEHTYPDSYSILNGSVYLSPVPSSATGKIRITYTRRLDDLDIRRGTISARTDSGTAITALTLSTTGDDVTALDAGTYLTVNDRDGTVTMYNLRYDSYDDSTGVVTITGSSFTYATGESAAVGDFVCTAPYGTTHSDLEDLTERYLILYTQFQILSFEESSADFGQAQTMLAALEQEIVDAYTPDGQDISYPTIVSNYFR